VNSVKKKQDALRKTVILNPPRHLVITLNRFGYDPKTMARTKILKEISYKESIIIAPSMDDEKEYVLYAVIMHSGGSTEYGHYYTYARHGSNTDSEWNRYNDSSVDTSSFSSFSAITKRFSKDVAYILFYVDKELCKSGLDKFQDISEEFQKQVALDNQKLINERKIRAKQASHYYSGAPHSSYSNRPEEDGAGGPGFNFGGGSFQRFVF